MDCDSNGDKKQVSDSRQQRVRSFDRISDKERSYSPSRHSEYSVESEHDAAELRKCRPFEVILYPKWEYLNYLQNDDGKLFKDLKDSVQASEFSLNDLEVGEAGPARVIKVFDQDQEKKWKAANILFDSYSTFLQNTSALKDGEMRYVIVIPDGKFVNFSSS